MSSFQERFFSLLKDFRLRLAIVLLMLLNCVLVLWALIWCLIVSLPLLLGVVLAQGSSVLRRWVDYLEGQLVERG